jgi:hypothetical protein
VPDNIVEWNAEKLPEELWVTCRVCGERGDPLDIDVFHRGCRLSRALPEAYEERDGLLIFAPKKMREQTSHGSEP